MFKISDLFDSSLNLIEQLDHSFTVHSEKTAIEEDCQKYTYEELRKNVHTLAEMISGLNSQYVAVIGEPSFSSVVSVLGTVFSGCVYVPVDPSWPIERN